MKRKLWIGLVVALWAAAAFWLIPQADVLGVSERQARLSTYEIRYIKVRPSMVNAGVAGQSGMLAAALAYSGGAYSHMTWTSSIVQPPYAAKLKFAFTSTLAPSTAQCATTQLWGISATGRSVAEKLGGAVTTVTRGSSLAYAKLQKVAFTGCGGATAANTKIMIWPGTAVALPLPIFKASDVNTICRYAMSVAGGASAQEPVCTNGTNLLNLKVDPVQNTIDLGKNGPPTLSHGDRVVIRHYAPSFQ